MIFERWYTGGWQICLAPASNLRFEAPTDLKVANNRTLTINALDYVQESSPAYTITCGDATNVDSTELDAVSRGSGANSCMFTIRPKNVQGAASFRVPYTTSGSSTVVNGTIPITVGPPSDINFVAPGDLIVGRNRTLEINASAYVTEDSSYTVTCGEATSLDARLSTVSQASTGSCVYTVTPSPTAVLGIASFVVPYVSDGGDSTTETVSLRVGPPSTIVFTAPDPALKVATNKVRVINALDYVRDGNYTIRCADATSIDTTELATVTRDASGAGCKYTITPTSTEGPANFTVVFTSVGGHTLRQVFSITVGPASTIAYVAPPTTGPNSLSVAANRKLVVDASDYVSETSGSGYVISCDNATGIDSHISHISRSGCSYTITPATAGTATFTVPYTSDGGDTENGEITITIGAATNIVFRSPVALRMTASSTYTVNAASYATDGDYVISCKEATSVSNKFTSVTRTGCNYELVTGTSNCTYQITIATTATGTTNFTVPYTSSGGDRHNGQITITINPLSDIQYAAPTGLEIGAGNTRTINLASYATDGTYVIFCRNATATDATRLTSIVRNGCDYTITAASDATLGDTTFTLRYTSSGGDTHDATVTIKIDPASNIIFDPHAEALTTTTFTTLTINAGNYATDGDYSITCSEPANIDEKFSSVIRNGCTYRATAASITGDATFTITYTSSGGDTHRATIHVTITHGGQIFLDLDLSALQPENEAGGEEEPDGESGEEEPTDTENGEEEPGEEEPDPDDIAPTVTTQEADQPGPRWNTYTTQTGGTTTAQIREAFNLPTHPSIHTWNPETQAWNPAPPSQ